MGEAEQLRGALESKKSEVDQLNNQIIRIAELTQQSSSEKLDLLDIQKTINEYASALPLKSKSSLKTLDFDPVKTGTKTRSRSSTPTGLATPPSPMGATTAGGGSNVTISVTKTTSREKKAEAVEF